MKSTPMYPALVAQVGKSRSVSQAGGVLLTEVARATGLDQGLSQALAQWRSEWAIHDPGKIILDMALAVACGGEHLSDLSAIRCEPGVFGQVASDPVVSRLFSRLGQAPATVERLVGHVLAAARSQAWMLAGVDAPHQKASRAQPLVVDLDATLITAHSDKEHAKPTFKKTFGHHPLLAFADYGDGGTGEPLHMLLRPGNAGSNTAADHISVARTALSRLPIGPSKKILVRADGGGGTKDFIGWLTRRGVQYSLGYTLPDNTPEIYHQILDDCWTPALNDEGKPRDGADVAEITSLLDLSGWPTGMRVIIRRERPHPGAQLRFDDVDGYRITGFATNTKAGQHAALELRHRRRARCEDRIRVCKATGLHGLPLQGFGPNRIWLLVVQIASCLIAWSQILALAGSQAGLWEPKRLRLYLYSCPAEIIHSARRVIIRFNQAHPGAAILADAIPQLRCMRT